MCKVSQPAHPLITIYIIYISLFDYTKPYFNIHIVDDQVASKIIVDRENDDKMENKIETKFEVNQPL